MAGASEAQVAEYAMEPAIGREAPDEEGKCVISGEPSERRVIYAKSY